MEKQIIESRWIEIDGPMGTEFVPFDVVFRSQNEKTLNPSFSDVRDYCENDEAYSVSVRDGFGARLSTPGYLDCTPWAVFDTKDAAKEFLVWLKG